MKPPARALRSNFGFQRLEVLEGNVGYIDLRGFYRPEFAAHTVDASMDLIANTDALNLDLRRNQGGDGAMVRWLASYCFGDAPVHLADVPARRENRRDPDVSDGDRRAVLG